jgi:hypothetical protein
LIVRIISIIIGSSDGSYATKEGETTAEHVLTTTTKKLVRSSLLSLNRHRTLQGAGKSCNDQFSVCNTTSKTLNKIELVTTTAGEIQAHILLDT